MPRPDLELGHRGLQDQDHGAEEGEQPHHHHRPRLSLGIMTYWLRPVDKYHNLLSGFNKQPSNLDVKFTLMHNSPLIQNLQGWNHQTVRFDPFKIRKKEFPFPSNNVKLYSTKRFSTSDLMANHANDKQNG